MKLLFLLICCFFSVKLFAETTQNLIQKEKLTVNKFQGAKEFKKQRRLGVALFGSSSVGTNLLEYNFIPQLTLGVGLGIAEGYNPTKIDKIKFASKFYVFQTQVSPYAAGGMVFKENLYKMDSKNYPYVGVGAQYFAYNGISVALEMDYFREDGKNNFKPGFSVLWFLSI